MIHNIVNKLTDSLYCVSRYVKFALDFARFRRMSGGSVQRFPMKWSDRYPCLSDRTPNTGFDRHYVYYLAWAARVLTRSKPSRHLDISSSIQFCTLVSAFIPVSFYDYRPVNLGLDGLSCEWGDLLELPFPDRSIPSLSCMHVVEHIGLGRYGDPLDPDGDLKAISELKRVLAPGGNLLFVVPLGKPNICYNAHRVYSLDQILGYFSDLVLEEFAIVPDIPSDGGLIFDPPAEMVDRQRYACGCFRFVRNDVGAPEIRPNEGNA